MAAYSVVISVLVLILVCVWRCESGVYIFPVPLGVPTEGRCVGFDPATFHVIIADDCSVSFAYDEHSFRESSTAKIICPGRLTSGSDATLTTSCAHELRFESLITGGSRICVLSSPSLCADVRGFSPGTRLTFVDGSDKKFTLIFKVPGAVKFTSFGVSITYNPDKNWQIEVASSGGEALFYYDGEYIREATTHRCIGAEGTNDNDRVVLAGGCLAMTVQYDVPLSVVRPRGFPAQTLIPRDRQAFAGREIVVHEGDNKISFMFSGI